ncbi:MAG TPA: hypothetical protein VFK38_03450 [Candidatus Limnocylindrales bacterium]|nr:hypothetical protein [Candidatus Limnocylindrales bacterium]
MGDPGLWLLGLLGFLARGGLIVLLAPILTLPSPVGISTLLGADAIRIGGLSERTALLLALGVVAVAAAVVAGLLVGAWAELAAFERLLAGPEVEPLLGHRAAAGLAGGRGWLIVDLAALRLVALAPAAGALLLATTRLVEATWQEFLLPGRLDVPLVLRVVVAARDPLLLLAVLVVAGDLAATVGTRLLLGRRVGRRPFGPADGPKAGIAGRVLRAWLGGWSVTLAVLCVALLSLTGAWTWLKTVLLDPGFGLGAGPLGALLAALPFALVWAAALVLVGLGSALRSAIWSTEALL